MTISLKSLVAAASLTISTTIFVASISNAAEIDRSRNRDRRQSSPPVEQTYNNQQVPSPDTVTDDSQVVSANQGRRQLFFVQGANLEVIRILPDDTKGLPHQKWMAQLSDGSSVLIVYNSDMGARVPVRVGDRFAVGGQYIWTSSGGLIHWTHFDPKHTRPDGYVLLNGVEYGTR